MTSYKLHISKHLPQLSKSKWPFHLSLQSTTDEENHLAAGHVNKVDHIKEINEMVWIDFPDLATVVKQGHLKYIPCFSYSS